MNNQNNTNQHYFCFDRVFFGLSGLTFLVIFISLLKLILAEGNTNSIFIAPFFGYVGYLFIYTAYKGQTPTWFNDISFFGQKKSKIIK